MSGQNGFCAKWYSVIVFNGKSGYNEKRKVLNSCGNSQNSKMYGGIAGRKMGTARIFLKTTGLSGGVSSGK